jgi:hypothetical protein
MRTLLKLFLVTTVAGLLPSNAFAFDDNDVKRALKARNMNDYGFTDMAVFCDKLSENIVNNTSKYASKPKPYHAFTPDTHQSNYITGYVNYFVNISKIPIEGVRSRPFFRKIYSQFNIHLRQINTMDKTAFKSKIEPYLDACDHISLELSVNAQPTEQQIINIKSQNEKNKSKTINRKNNYR